jgi:hypothetical protein
LIVDRLANTRHAGRVGHREIVARGQRVLVELGDLAALVHLEGAVGPRQQLDALDRVHGLDDLIPVSGAARIDGDVPHDLVVVRLDDVDRADRAARVPNRRRHLSEHARFVLETNPERDTE